jgi:hypothetical protein
LFGCLLACLYFCIFVFCFSQVAPHLVLFFSSYSNFFAAHLSFGLSPFWKSGEGEKVVVVVVVGMLSSFVCSRCGKEGEEEEEEEEKIVRLFKLCFSFVGLCFCLLSVF